MKHCRSNRQLTWFCLVVFEDTHKIIVLSLEAIPMLRAGVLAPRNEIFLVSAARDSSTSLFSNYVSVGAKVGTGGR